MMRGATRFLAPLPVLCAVILALCATAAAQEKPGSPVLRVAASRNARAMFDRLVEDLVHRRAPGPGLVVKDTDSLTALHDFCQGTNGSSPDLVLSTHRMQAALAAECARNGIDDIAEVELGRSALVLAVRGGGMLTGLTSRQVWLAIAREVPYREEFVRNTAVRWSDVDPSLPAQDIRFQLPMRDEPLRAMLNADVLEGGCRHEGAVKQIFAARSRAARCITTRTDRVREIPRAQALRALLEAPVGTVGVLSHVDISQSDGAVVALRLDGESPSYDSILRGTYDHFTSYWLYARRGQAARGGDGAVDAAVEHIVELAQSEAMIGPGGKLPELGLVPLPLDARIAQRDALASRTRSYGVWSALGWVASVATGAWGMFGIGPSQLPPGDHDDAVDFTTLMDIAGYRVTGIGSSIGVLPEASMSFGIAREMSDADQAYLERTLHRDSLRRPGAVPAAQRAIIRAIMDKREISSFEVNKVEVVFLPLPKVSLTLSPKDGGGADDRPPGRDSTDIQ